ncbi:ATPase [Candidatus Woesearchaeota archaeon]|nr:ATPase [Candidatus Woesearchaeota archaeon]
MTDVIDIRLQRDELNRNLGGGLPKNSLILVEGEDGSGKSILSQRICYALLENGRRVTYISTELNTMGFIEQMASLDYDVKYHMLEGKVLFLPMFPFLGKAKLSSDFIDRLFSERKIFENEVIIFDTLSFLMVDENLAEEKAFQLVKLIKGLNSLNKTIILNVNPGHLNERLLTLLRSMCDVYFKLELKDFAGQKIRVINIQRFKRPADSYIYAIPFKVEPGKGLTIEIASFT